MIRDILLLIIKYSTRYLICLEECKKKSFKNILQINIKPVPRSIFSHFHQYASASTNLTINVFISV